MINLFNENQSMFFAFDCGMQSYSMHESKTFIKHIYSKRKIYRQIGRYYISYLPGYHWGESGTKRCNKQWIVLL